MSAPLSTRPLEAVTSIKLKLGVLVGASVLLGTVLTAFGVSTGVPWWLFIPTVVVIALGVTQLLAVGMTAPLREMTQAAQRMAQGDYDVRVRASANDEIGTLARAFNAMAADLASVDAERRELVATVAHELRTPLTALSAHMENLADGVIPADAAGLGTAVTQVERLRALVRDLLELSKVEAGVTPLAVTQIPIAQLLSDCVLELGLTNVETRVEPADLTVAADASRLRQVIDNLLDNAARHSPAPGLVRLSAQQIGSSVRIEVADQGAGIEPADRERIFDRYGTLDPSTGGTGLGLAISRMIVGLHGGTIAAVDPLSGEEGARMRIELPLQSHRILEAVSTAADGSVPATDPGAVGTYAAPTPTPIAQPVGSWPDTAPETRWVVAAALVIGLIGGVALPYRQIGLALTLLMLAAGAVVWGVSVARRTWFTRACAGLCVLLAFVPTLRSAPWLTVLSLLAAASLLTAGTTQARTVSGFVQAGLAWPLAAIRSLPWLSRVAMRGPGSGAQRVRVIRTLVLTLIAVSLFAGLLTSGDALMAKWVDAVLPDLSLNTRLAYRGFVAVAIAVAVLSAAYLAMSPPTVVDGFGPRPSPRRFEWLVPVLAIDAVFAVFLAAQAAAFFGGHDYVRRTTGLTYAEYVHQGFAQLTLATMLTLVVLRVGLHKAAADTASDRLWIRIAFGSLCALTLVVVASALHRMALYQAAYGFTQARMLVDVYEGWLGLVLIFVLIAGVIFNGRWVARAALLSGAVCLLGLAAINPDAFIAKHNIDRVDGDFQKVDQWYMRSLSADAVPTIEAEGGAFARCLWPSEVVGPRRSMWHENWISWNLGRARAKATLKEPVLHSADDDELCGAYF